MGGFMLYVDKTPYHTLQPDEVLKLIRAGCIDAPTITAKRIHDKSKGNAISKGLVMLQMTWFIMQLITRAIYHLETTQLEVGTLAFAVLNFLTYAAWWNKPLDVQCPYPVYWKSAESRPEDHINIPEMGALTWFQNLLYDLVGISDIPTSRKLRVPTFDGSIELKDSDGSVLWIAAFLMASMFGGIHCMAWFFAFPTYQDQVLWRMSAVAITCTPWSGLYVVSIVMMVSHASITEPINGLIMLIICPMVYIIGRAVLLVLMFTTLRNLPPDAYTAVLWTSLMPHL
ncbi:hypothetical protein BDR03DRAFT_948893 [Suillus americanus]|nr:hypothetical protein BDR03DRAFT_948893 [Suillus americanus]